MCETKTYPNAVKESNIDLGTLNSEDLRKLYNELDSQIKDELLNGSSWEAVKNKIEFLTDLSKELENRNLLIRRINDTPASSPFREE